MRNLIKIASIGALAVTLAACGKKNDTTTPDGGGGGGGGAGKGDPSVGDGKAASVEAKADFEKAVKSYLSAKSDGNNVGPPSNPNDPCKWHEWQNGSFRMGVAYQTGSGSFNQKSKLGVGCADAGNNVTWWVLLFE